MSEILELEPFPLAGICASYLDDILDELEGSFVKVTVRLLGKNEIAPKALVRLSEKLGNALGGGKVKSIVEVSGSAMDSVTVTAIIIIKSLAPRGSAVSLNSPTGVGSSTDVAAKIR